MKKLRVGMIGGGGPGSFFGGVHLRAISLDGSREVVAGALRSNPDAALEAAEEWGIEGYRDFNEMVEAYKKGQLDLDYVTIATPNRAHFEPAKACAEAGLPILCEKPMTFTVEEAEELADIIKKNNVPFILAHTYTGHPMMMLAKRLIEEGKIGAIRKIQSWYTQGWLGSPLEKEGVQQAAWRTDPEKAGISNCGGDIGTHAFVAATWVSGLNIKRMAARLNTFVPDRALDDDFNVFAEMDNGAMAVIHTTQVATGYRNDSGFRIHGTEGSLEWHQEDAEHLTFLGPDAETRYSTGLDYGGYPDPIGSFFRVPSGHNEDFFPALANLHCSLERTIRREKGEDVGEPFEHPGIDEGVAGMKFVKAAVDSSKADSAWVSMD